MTMNEPPRDWSLLTRQQPFGDDYARQQASARHLDEMLARTAEAVAGWQVELDFRVTEEGDDRGAGLSQAHLVCTVCRQSVLCLSKDLSEGAAVVSPGMITDGVTRHYREAHTDGGGNPE